MFFVHCLSVRIAVVELPPLPPRKRNDASIWRMSPVCVCVLVCVCADLPWEVPAGGERGCGEGGGVCGGGGGCAQGDRGGGSGGERCVPGRRGDAQNTTGQGHVRLQRSRHEGGKRRGKWSPFCAIFQCLRFSHLAYFCYKNLPSQIGFCRRRLSKQRLLCEHWHTDHIENICFKQQIYIILMSMWGKDQYVFTSTFCPWASLNETVLMRQVTVGHEIGLCSDMGQS